MVELGSEGRMWSGLELWCELEWAEVPSAFDHEELVGSDPIVEMRISIGNCFEGREDEYFLLV